jgi:ParB-like chromosome segregation protein Spo0J
MSSHALEFLPIDQLRSSPRNARTHSRKQIRQIAEGIGRFGFTNPVLIDDEKRILAGHGRVEAARERGMSAVPCLRVGHLSAAEKRAYVLADNKLALNAGWDEELLGLELKELMESDIEFDVGLTGFSIAEVDQLVEGLAHEDVGDPSDDRLPDPNRVVARCRRGDIWQAGSHRLTFGRHSRRLHQHPACGGQGSGRREPFSKTAFQATDCFGSSTWIRQD